MKKWIIIFFIFIFATSISVSGARDIDDGIGFDDNMGFDNDLGKKVNVNFMKQKGKAKQRSAQNENDLFGEDSPGNLNSVVVDGNVKGDIIIIDEGK